MPKAIKRKVSAKTQATEAEVKDKLASLKDTISERRKSVLRYGALIIGVIIVVSGFLLYDYTSRKKATMLEYEAYKIYHNISTKGPLTKEDQYTRALEAFRKSYDTRKSPTALFYITACQYELGKYDEALKTLNEFISKYSKEEKLIPLAYQKIAMTYVKKGNTKDAMEALEKLYNLKGDIYKDFALIEYARLLEKEGKIEEAKKKYKELSERFPNSPFIDEAKTKLSEEKKG